MWPGVAGQDGVRDFLTMLIGAAPDLRLEIDDLIENGDRAAVRFRMTGTHTGGPLFGVPPTGASLDVNAINIYRVESGRIAETWQRSDGLSVYRAIGILKPISDRTVRAPVDRTVPALRAFLGTR